MMLNYLHKILEKALLLVLAFGVVACSEGITITDLRNGDLFSWSMAKGTTSRM